MKGLSEAAQFYLKSRISQLYAIPHIESFYCYNYRAFPLTGDSEQQIPHDYRIASTYTGYNNDRLIDEHSKRQNPLTPCIPVPATIRAENLLFLPKCPSCNPLERALTKSPLASNPPSPLDACYRQMRSLLFLHPHSLHLTFVVLLKRVSLALSVCTFWGSYWGVH